MATFVLIHGAFRGGFSFVRVRPLLHAAGHSSYAPSLPGAGEHVLAEPRPLALDDYARCVARLLELEDLTQVILVGHSQGGLVISAASQLAHARIARLVFLDSPVPRHGERAVDLVAPALAHLTMPTLTREQWVPPRPLVETADLTATDAAWLNARLCPTPVGPSLDALVLTEAAALALPRHYLFCRRTPETFPCAHGRARLDAEGVPYSWLDADHDVPLTAPSKLAAALLTIAASTATAQSHKSSAP